MRYTKALSKGSAVGLMDKRCFSVLTGSFSASLLVNFSSCFSFSPSAAAVGGNVLLAFLSLSWNSILVFFSAASLWSQPTGFHPELRSSHTMGSPMPRCNSLITCLLDTVGLEVGIHARASPSPSLFVGAKDRFISTWDVFILP